jgi:hypothetical protein
LSIIIYLCIIILNILLATIINKMDPYTDLEPDHATGLYAYSDHDTEPDDCDGDYNYDYDCDTDDSPIKIKISTEEMDEMDNFEEMYEAQRQQVQEEELSYQESIQIANRDEFIYKYVFNNDMVLTEVPIDISMGTLEEWTATCSRFNTGEMILEFATLYMYEKPDGVVIIICDNIHPFMNNNSLTELTNLLNAHVIHD